MRGLKQFSLIIVATYKQVASFTDAWIETLSAVGCGFEGKSHLLQMRGLKLSTFGETSVAIVASFTDAWIETVKSGWLREWKESHLLQMRGLKP